MDVDENESDQPSVGGDANARAEPHDAMLADAIVDSVEDDPEPKQTESVPTDVAAALGPPRHVSMTIVAHDPSVIGEDGRILTSEVRVPADRLREPFRSHRFIVVNYDPDNGRLGPNFRLLTGDRFVDQFARITDRQIVESHDFHAQNVYAIAARTLAAFEGALGRRVPWAFGRHQLYLIPHAFEEANAHYSEEKHGILFGYVGKASSASGQPMYSCLSHDIVAHETSHAILAGLRPEYLQPSLPDQRGFHEAFADLVALLSVFAVPAVVERALGETHGNGRIAGRQAGIPALRESILFQLGE